jgi:hypothetical protein
MTEDLGKGDLALAVARKFRNMIGDPVGEAQQTVLHEHPDSRCGNHFRIRKEQPERVGGGRRLRDDRGSAERLEQREAPVPGKRDLRARIAALRDMRFDQLLEPRERRLVKAELDGTRHLEWKFGHIALCADTAYVVHFVLFMQCSR